MIKRSLKKMIPVTLAAITALTSVFVLGNTKHAAYGEELIKNSQGDEVTIKYGDINGDGSINVGDGVTLKKHLAGMSIQINEVASDVNLDGKINTTDAVLLMRHLAGMNVELGVAQQPTAPEPTTPEETTPEEQPTVPDEDDYFVYPHDPAYMQPTEREKNANQVIRELGLKKSMSRAEIITTYLTAEFNAYKDYYTTPDDSADKAEKKEKSNKYSSKRRDVLKVACGIPYREDTCEDYGMTCTFDFIITTMEDGSILYSDIFAAEWYRGEMAGDWDINNIILLVSKEEMNRITAEKYGCVWK